MKKKTNNKNINREKRRIHLIRIINDIYPGGSTHLKSGFQGGPASDRIGIWTFLSRGENRRKTSRSRVKNQLNPLMATSPKSKPGPRRWESSEITTTLSLLPADIRNKNVHLVQKLDNVTICKNLECSGRCQPRKFIFPKTLSISAALVT